MKRSRGAAAAPATNENRLNGTIGTRRAARSRVAPPFVDRALEPIEPLGLDEVLHDGRCGAAADLIRQHSLCRPAAERGSPSRARSRRRSPQRRRGSPPGTRRKCAGPRGAAIRATPPAPESRRSLRSDAVSPEMASPAASLRGSIRSTAATIACGEGDRQRDRPAWKPGAPGCPAFGPGSALTLTKVWRSLRSEMTIGAPGFEPGTSPTRTVRATRLRHAPRGRQGYPVPVPPSDRSKNAQKGHGINMTAGRSRLEISMAAEPGSVRLVRTEIMRWFHELRHRDDELAASIAVAVSEAVGNVVSATPTQAREPAGSRWRRSLRSPASSSA